LHQNTVFNCGRKPKETTGNTKELYSQNQFFLDYLSFPLVSFDFLWFGAGGFYGFSLFSFGFQGGNKGIPNPRQYHNPIMESLSRL
jgi:hypothetical protein